MPSEPSARICLAKIPGSNPIALAESTVRLVNRCLCERDNSCLRSLAALDDAVEVVGQLESMAIFRGCSEGNRLEIASRKLLIVKFEQTFDTGGDCEG